MRLTLLRALVRGLLASSVTAVILVLVAILGRGGGGDLDILPLLIATFFLALMIALPVLVGTIALLLLLRHLLHRRGSGAHPLLGNFFFGAVVGAVVAAGLAWLPFALFTSSATIAFIDDLYLLVGLPMGLVGGIATGGGMVNSLEPA